VDRLSVPTRISKSNCRLSSADQDVRTVPLGAPRGSVQESSLMKSPDIVGCENIGKS
jgi:hypothetical protein